MTTFPADVAETELRDWLTSNIGDQITNDYDAATQLLTAFDFRAKDSTSLNNQHQIASCIAPTPAACWVEPPVALTVSAAAQHLLVAFHVTRKPANYETIFIGMPTPIVVARHQCPFCRRFTRADHRQVQDHMTRCWQNPALRCCRTCPHHQPEVRTSSGIDDWDESCTHPDGPDFEEYRFPVLHCPLWEARGT